MRNWVDWFVMHSTHLFARLSEWRDMQLPRYLHLCNWVVRTVVLYTCVLLWLRKWRDVHRP